jgi:hypothetical protein
MPSRSARTTEDACPSRMPTSFGTITLTGSAAARGAAGVVARVVDGIGTAGGRPLVSDGVTLGVLGLGAVACGLTAIESPSAFGAALLSSAEEVAKATPAMNSIAADAANRKRTRRPCHLDTLRPPSRFPPIPIEARLPRAVGPTKPSAHNLP